MDLTAKLTPIEGATSKEHCTKPTHYTIDVPIPILEINGVPILEINGIPMPILEF